MNDYISKPVDPDILEKKLVKWLSVGKGSLNQNGMLSKGDDGNPSVQLQSGISVASKSSRQPVETAGKNTHVWDREAFLKRVRGKADRAAILIEMYLRDMPGRVNHFRQLVEAGQTDEASKLAHEIKGVSINLGGIQVEKIASMLETAGAQDDAETLMELYPKMANEFQKFRRLLQDELPVLRASSKASTKPGAEGSH